MLEQILRIFGQQRTAAQIRVVAPPESPDWKKFDSAQSWKKRDGSSVARIARVPTGGRS